MEKRNEQKKEKQSNQKPNILVVGDWYIDEHWVMGVHRSPTSSRTGDAHYRALHGMESSVQSFCGAGMAASLLYQTKIKNKSLFNIFGLGLWHKDDTEIIQEMFDSAHLKGQTLFKLNRHVNFPQLSDIKLFNICNALPPKAQKNICTTRIIRLYHSLKPDEIKYYRMDWELPLMKIPPTSIEKAVNKLPDHIDAIVIKDLVKGVITDYLIEKLVEKYGHKPEEKKSSIEWFVSSKAWNPPWLNRLKDVNLKVLIIPQTAADQALQQPKNEKENEEVKRLGCWITRSGQVGQEVFASIKNIISIIGNQDPKFRIIILPKDFSAIEYKPFSKGKSFDCIIQTETNPYPPLLPMGMASIFLPAIIADYFIRRTSKIHSKGEPLERCLQWTYQYIKSLSQRLLQPENWEPQPNFYDTSNIDVNSNETHFVFKNISWETEDKIWKQATSGTGVINVSLKSQSQLNPIPSGTEKKFLELWRSTIEVDGYACCITEKRQEIFKLIKGINRFLAGEKKHHVGCMLVASPGTGKTTLVRKMADSLHLRYLPFNITQMSSRADLLDCFDSIVTTQAQNRSKPILVFVDEINSDLDNAPVYNAFLAPLEDGIYIRGGKAFHIDPCIWIFAGTEDTDSNSTHQHFAKRSDFISRLELGVIKLKEEVPGEHERKLENVYLGISQLVNEFQDVRYVREKVLRVFHGFPDNITARQIKQLVKSFKNIQYGEVFSHNVPIELFKEMNPNLEEFELWNKRDEGERIEITDLPPRSQIEKCIPF